MFLLAVTLVVCAPNYPGSSQEAQPAMDALAKALSQSLPVNAVYEETAAGGLRRLESKDAALLLSPLPFFLEQQAKLKLEPKLMAKPKDGEALQQWTLVSSVDQPEEIASTAGYSEKFVRAMSGSQAKVTSTQQVLSALRKAASGPQGVLLDEQSAKALKTLPFAAQLKTLHTSPRVPVALISIVSKRLTEAQWKQIEQALLSLPPEALEAVQMAGFVPLDAQALAAAK